MSLDTALSIVQTALLLLNWPVGIVLARAALRRPHEWSLTIMALTTLGIAVVVTSFLLAIANAGAGYPLLSQEHARIALRLLFLPLGVVPLLFMWVYWTRRFGGGAK